MTIAGRRVPVLALGAFSLLAGLAGGLARIGAGSPSPATAAAGHGVLMTLGFLGTLIALERAVALRRWWGYAAPVLSGLGGVTVVAGLPTSVSALVFAAAGAWLVAAYVVMLQTQPTLHLVVESLGAVAWWAAAVVWLRGADLPALVPWLAVFVVLTIAGERLELARVALLGHDHRPAVLGWTALLLLGPLVTLASPEVGLRLLALGLLALAAWLVRHDVARHTVRASGLTRYMAVCLLTGYAWMTAAGVLWLVRGPVVQGGAYDAVVHSVFLGFAMSMVLGHAPVILPAVLRVRLPHHRRDYGPLVLLHAGLLVRVVGADLAGVAALRIAGGVVGVVALLSFIIGAAASAVGAARRPGRSPVGPRSLTESAA
ncbi:MAG: hypothetical protein ACTHLJ_02325 [Angustibacter sp.]